MFEYTVNVDNVVDGDTVDVCIDLGFKVQTRQRIRLSGIDTPERGKPGFTEAKNALSNLVLGKSLKMQSSKISKWGYYLGDFYTQDGLHVNRQLIDMGLARPYDGGAKS